MTLVFPAALHGFSTGLWCQRTASVVNSRSASLSLTSALPIQRRFAISTIAFCHRPHPSHACQHAIFRRTPSRRLSTQARLLARPVYHPPSAEEGEAAAAVGDGVDDSSPLAQEELNEIFGQEIDREGAAELLSRLQKQRREGRLDEGLPYPEQMVERALEYLRGKYPLDEDAAIVARLDMELDGHWSLPQMYPEKSPTGKSALDEIRKITKEEREKVQAELRAEVEELRLRKLKREKREAQKAEKKLIGDRAAARRGQKGLALARKNDAVRSIEAPSETSSGSKLVAFSEARERRVGQVAEWVERSNKRVAQLRAEATMQKLPQMTRWQRLWRSGLFTFGVVGFGLAFAHFYTPPSPNARLFPTVPPAIAAVGGIIAINLVLFGMWRVPHAWKMMNKYFMVVPAVPRAFSMLGAEFSHQKFPHLAANMVAMWLLGLQLHDDIGRGPFLALVLCGAVLPSFAALVPHVMMKIFITATLGASGIITTFIGTSCVLHEGLKISIIGLPPEWTSWINTGVLLPMFLFVEVRNLCKFGLMPRHLINTGRPTLDYAGHLAGYGTGIAAGCLIRQTSPYWGGKKRESFWMQYGAKDEDAKATSNSLATSPDT